MKANAGDCQGPHCESVTSHQNIASQLKHKSMVPGTQLLIADDVDPSSEGESCAPTPIFHLLPTK